MNTQTHCQNLPASNPPWNHAGLATPLVDRATALELRRTTKPTAFSKRASRRRSSVDLCCPPTIRTMEYSLPGERPSSVPVVIVAPGQGGSIRGKKLTWKQIKLDLSWMAAPMSSDAATAYRSGETRHPMCPATGA